MAGHIAILGVFVADTAYRADRAPRMGETILGNSFALGPGGKGSNQAVAAARAGGKTHILTRLGKDTFAELALETWRDAGVIPEVSQHEDEYTGAAYIFIEEATGNNAIIVCPGAGMGITPANIDACADLIASASVFVTQLEQPIDAAMRALEIAKSGGAQTILNPAPAADLPSEIFPLCNFVTPNESEAEAITGIKVTDIASAKTAADAFLDLGVGSALITLGENGALLGDKDGHVHVPAFNAGPVVETTGAGDAFNGGFAVGLCEGLDPAAAARFGAATAAISVTRPGTAPSMPNRAEIDALFQATR
jgi:ribokinase